ncbi:MAG: hypothetical protein ACKVU1_00625 [bacterium]
MNAGRYLSIPIAIHLLLATATALNAEVFTIRSGSAGGDPGSSDPFVRMLVASTTDGPIPGPFTAAQFLAAVNGPYARITTTNMVWGQSLSADPLARWINNTGESGSGRAVMYAVPIALYFPFDTAVLSLDYMIDDHLGENPGVPSGNTRPGIYVNGVPLPDTNGIGDFSSQHFFTAQISALLNVGLNYVYLYCYDQNVDSGIIFSMTVSTSLIGNSTAESSWGSVKALFR